MSKARLILSLIFILAGTAAVYAFKISKNNRRLFYLSANGNCIAQSRLTTTAATATQPIGLPSGAVAGWFTDNICMSPTTKATTVND